MTAVSEGVLPRREAKYALLVMVGYSGAALYFVLTLMEPMTWATLFGIGATLYYAERHGSERRDLRLSEIFKFSMAGSLIAAAVLVLFTQGFSALGLGMIIGGGVERGLVFGGALSLAIYGQRGSGGGVPETSSDPPNRPAAGP